MTLDLHGAGCRCLLRARENLGNPPLTDAAFIAEHLSEYPDWAEAPGAAGVERLVELARSLGLARRGELIQDYGRVAAAHAAGELVLVRTTREPRRAACDAPGAVQIALLMEMDATHLTLWAPAADGSAETLTVEQKHFWEPMGATGLVLFRAKADG